MPAILAAAGRGGMDGGHAMKITTNYMDNTDMALRIMASKAREARDAWQRELAACQAKGLIKSNPYSVPASLTERFAHWTMANLMLHTAATHLKFSGRNTHRVDVYVRNLIEGAS
jgi:hypothetical protein